MKAVAALTAACAFAGASVIAFGPDAKAQSGCLPGDALVSISGYSFTPSTVTVAPGSGVCWTNRDSVAHTVTNPDFDSGELGLDATYRRTFPSSGSVNYYCAVPGHNMPGTVVVSAGQPPPPPPPPAAGKRQQTVSGFGVQVARVGGTRWLVARARVARSAPARLQLLRHNRPVAGMRTRVRAGRNVLRLRLRRTLPRGRYVVRLTVGGAPRPYTARIAIG